MRHFTQGMTTYTLCLVWNLLAIKLDGKSLAACERVNKFRFNNLFKMDQLIDYEFIQRLGKVIALHSGSLPMLNQY